MPTSRLTTLLLGTSAALFATFGTVMTPASAQEVETVVVSATRTTQPLAKTGTTVTVIDATDLDARQSVSLTDALSDVPGLSVNRTGGAGQTTTVYLRGADSGQTLTLIDGIRLNDPSDVSGSANYGDLFVNNIDRIEVMRGANSTLYGSNAMAGVINIITKRGGDTALTASAEVGTFDSWRVNVAGSGTVGATEFGVAVNDYATKGISAAAGQHEADGTANQSLNINTRTHLSDTISVDVIGYYDHAHTEYDDGYDTSYNLADSATYETHSLYSGYVGVNQTALDGILTNRLALIASSSKRDFFDSAYDSIHHNYAYDGGAFRIEYQGVAKIDDSTELSFGAESEATYLDNDTFSSYAATDHIAGHKRTTSGYGQLQKTLFNQLTLTVGARTDNDEEFGSHSSVKVAAAWQIPGLDATLHANYGDGFKSPTLYQLYSAYSNPIDALKPESARTWEVGADKSFFDGRLHTSLTYFWRHTSNQIDWQNCYSASDAPGCSQRLAQYGYYVNIDRTKANGIEAAVDTHLTDTLTLSANYTYMNATDRDTGLDLARRPHYLANANLRWQATQDLGLGVAMNYLGQRFNTASETTKLGAKEKVDLFADYNIDAHWQIYGRIENLFNDRTPAVTSYAVEGLGASIGVRARL
ncbi:MAG: TonB-dependent receptor [Rhizomicrobium sp.]